MNQSLNLNVLNTIYEIHYLFYPGISGLILVGANSCCGDQEEVQQLDLHLTLCTTRKRPFPKSLNTDVVLVCSHILYSKMKANAMSQILNMLKKHFSTFSG